MQNEGPFRAAVADATVLKPTAAGMSVGRDFQPGEALALHRRQIAAAGGVVGSWPSGFGGTTLKDFADRIFALTEVVGPRHVALGTDMDGNYRPTMSTYRPLPLLVSELLRRGYGEDTVIGLVGGNFRRLFRANWAARKG